MTLTTPSEQAHLRALSQLTLANGLSTAPLQEALQYVSGLDPEGRADLLSLSDSHHVLVRALQSLKSLAAGAANADLVNWASETLSKESARIENALKHLEAIFCELEAGHFPALVIKSLDHWPDLGNDLDLFTLANEQSIVLLMRQRFAAQVEPRSWGDRLANKWNFAIPGLREAVEVHAQRLGQTGEHTELGRRMIQRAVRNDVGGYSFRVPAPEERVIVATLQRMYRHFYFRICDVLDTANLVQTNSLDYVELRRSADLCGIWPGVCTFLMIVSDYVKSYRGQGLELPREVVSAAKFGGGKVTVRDRFLRFPLMPQGAELYKLQVTQTARRGNIPATLRLTLLPPLASVAALAYRITGSDKGIW